MRLKEKEITDPLEIEKIIKKAHVCRLALNDCEYPYIVPMNFGFQDNELYFHSAREGRKIDLLKNNNKVGFEIEADVALNKNQYACDWGTVYKSIIGTGEVVFIDEFNEKTKAFDIIMKQYSDEKFEYKPSSIENTCIFKVKIISISGKTS